LFLGAQCNADPDKPKTTDMKKLLFISLIGLLASCSKEELLPEEPNCECYDAKFTDFEHLVRIQYVSCLGSHVTDFRYADSLDIDFNGQTRIDGVFCL
jgi:hypothetical protein